MSTNANGTGIGGSMSEFIMLSPNQLKSLIVDAVAEGVGLAMREQGISKSVFSEAEAAKYLNLASATLKQWRSAGKGPAYHKTGRSVHYSRKDLDAYKAANRIFTSGAPDAAYH